MERFAKAYPDLLSVRIEEAGEWLADEHYIRQVREADWWCEQQGYTLRNVPAIVLAQYVELRPKTYASRRALRCALMHYWDAFKRKEPPLWVLKVPRKGAPERLEVQQRLVTKMVGLSVEQLHGGERMIDGMRP